MSANVNYYYSGQGILYVGDRDETKSPPIPAGLIGVGNVPELTFNIEVTKFEHKESMSGGRLTDLAIIKEKKGTFEFKMENMDLDALVLGLWGQKATVSGGTVSTGAPDVLYLPLGGVNRRYPLMHPGVSAVVVKDQTDVTTYVAGTDYILDAVNGTIEIPATGAIASSIASTAKSIRVSYTYAGYKKMDAFTQSNAPTKWLRFEGINTIDDKAVIIDVYKAQFDPMTGYGLINEDLASVTMKGNLLADTLQLTDSKFFRQVNTAT